jgi:hypothetical protein
MLGDVQVLEDRYKLTITFDGPILGSQPGRDTPASDYLRDRLAADHPEVDVEDELESLPDELKKGTTGFHRDEYGCPLMYNYHIKGMLKEAANSLNGLGGIKAMRSKVADTVYVEPRRVVIQGTEMEPLERPLRAITMQGPRTSLARSEQIAEGAVVEFTIVCQQTPKFAPGEKLLRALLDKGARLGLMQWRGSSVYGSFSYTLAKM